MNILLIQFFVVAVLPLSLTGLAVYAWRQRTNRPQLAKWWSLTLLLAAVWSSRLLTNYLGREIGQEVSYTWRVITNYPLALLGTLMLLTTQRYLRRPLPYRRVRLVGPVLVLAALALDPAIWPYELPTLTTFPLPLGHFQLWAAVWVAAFIIPALVAWIQAESGLRQVPPSLYRNQVAYWFTTITLIGLGGILGLFRDSLGGQQIGALVLVVGLTMGTAAINVSHLPNLPLTLRTVLYHLARGGFVFGLGFGALYLLSQLTRQSPDQLTTLFVSTAIFTAVIIIGLLLFDQGIALARREDEDPAAPLREQLVLGGTLFSSTDLAHRFQRLIKHRITADSWLMEAHEGPAGAIVLRPLGRVPEKSAVMVGHSPFVAYLYAETEPLRQSDIDHLHTFIDIPPDEKEQIHQWDRELFVPVRTDTRLLGLLGLGPKPDNKAYTTEDLRFLAELAADLGRLMAQSRQIHALHRISEDVYKKNMSLAQTGRRQKELVALYEQFTELLSPELRRPFTQLEVALQRVESRLERQNGQSNGRRPAVTPNMLADMRAQVDESQAMVDNLIAIATHLEKQSAFEFQPVYADLMLRHAMHNLEAMAEARKNEMVLDMRGKILPVWGDETRLTEAFQQVLHNALKFNRIGDKVEMVCQMVDNEVVVTISDHGVGIPDEQLSKLWAGLTKLYGVDNQKGGRRRTRIGLPLVRFIIQSHGGRVAAESEYGVGTTVTIRLPGLLDTADLVAAEETAADAAADAAAEEKSATAAE